MNNSFENYQYDSCISRGICSINPRVSALIIVLVVFLKITVKYYKKLFDKNIKNDKVKDLILDTTALVVQGQEFTESGFLAAITRFKDALSEVRSLYKNTFGEDCFKNEEITSSEMFIMTDNITNSIKLGERIFKNTVVNIPPEIRDLHQIILVLSKSLSINLLDLESYGETFDKAFDIILSLFEAISPNTENSEELKKIIIEASKIDNELMYKIREIQSDRYGKQGIAEVSYTTQPAKTLLVVGSNIRELETILEELKESNIDIYTHDDMMLAHTFPKFKEYKNLKGQFGQGVENCLIDFATFPGPIILTKHSLHNIENLYRGRLFTTDNNLPKGVIRINNNDFTEVIKSAETAKGFKKGKVCETVSIGYNYDHTISVIKDKMSELNVKGFILIGLEKYSTEQKSYFEKLIKHIPENILIISFSYNIERNNLIHLNTCFDYFSILIFQKFIVQTGLPATIFMPMCDKSTISQMIYFSNQENTKVYVGKCTPIILNPSLMNTLEKDFNIKSISVAKSDLADSLG